MTFGRLVRAGLMLGLLGGTGCAREPKFKSPKLGELVLIKPIAVNQKLLHPPQATQALKLNVMWGGRMLTTEKGDTMLLFYDKDGKLLLSRSWAELENAYRDTDCNAKSVETLDGSLMGSALICDGSIDLHAISMIEGVNSKGEKRFATSWSVYRVNDEVTAASVGLY